MSNYTSPSQRRREKTFVASFSLPQDVAVGLNNLAASLQIPQSRLVTYLLAGGVREINSRMEISNLPDGSSAPRWSGSLSQCREIFAKSL
ncbi:hypothetical protein CI105_09345, partial [Candidatus Izimaplasma bacterium ZiA1]|uniref:hypothetical protein n=1 Tax=Candidatus Izimoplasma sp. ZiA1 TaxID=2024899 RepID=UPI000BC407B9